jgi:fructose-bisphosphate aldolase, class II
VELTAEIHQALAAYKVSGAQHGTSGNSSDRLRAIARQTTTTKANVATALQMISWGVEVNDYGNAIQDENGEFIKLKDQGVTDELWQEMKEYAARQGWKAGNYKKLNLVFENRILGQSREVRDRMAARVERFVYTLLADVFNAVDTAPLAVEAILAAGSFDPGPKAGRIEDPAGWTEEKIRERASLLDSDKGPEGDFED